MADKDMMNEAEAAVRGAKLPEGITLLDGTGMLQLQSFAQPAGARGYRAQWLAYLFYMTPPTGPDGEGARVFVRKISFGFLSNVTANPEATRRIIEREAQEFKKELDAGTATEVRDGDELP